MDRWQAGESGAMGKQIVDGNVALSGHQFVAVRRVRRHHRDLHIAEFRQKFSDRIAQ